MGAMDMRAPKATLDLPASEDQIILLDPEDRPEGVLPWHPFHNLLRVGPGANIVWRADLIPESARPNAGWA